MKTEKEMLEEAVRRMKAVDTDDESSLVTEEEFKKRSKDMTSSESRKSVILPVTSGKK